MCRTSALRLLILALVELAMGMAPRVRVGDLAPGTYVVRATVKQKVIDEEVFIKP